MRVWWRELWERSRWRRLGRCLKMSGFSLEMRLYERSRWVRLVREATAVGRLVSKLSDRSSKRRLEERGARLESDRERSFEDTRCNSWTAEAGERTLSGR